MNKTRQKEQNKIDSHGSRFFQLLGTDFKINTFITFMIIKHTTEKFDKKLKTMK